MFSVNSPNKDVLFDNPATKYKLQVLSLFSFYLGVTLSRTVEKLYHFACTTDCRFLAGETQRWWTLLNALSIVSVCKMLIKKTKMYLLRTFDIKMRGGGFYLLFVFCYNAHRFTAVWNKRLTNACMWSVCVWLQWLGWIYMQRKGNCSGLRRPI